MKNQQKSFKESEAMGDIKTLPETVEAQEQAKLEQSIEMIDTPDKFASAIGNAQLDGLEYVEVEERLFKHLVKNSKTPYITYGKPGIKVYKRGTREELEKIDDMSAESYSTYLAKKTLDGQL